MPYQSILHCKRSAFVFLLALFLLVCRNANAGWYNVTNYEGQVGTYPVHLSIQKYESSGDGLTILGSYYYDRHMAPIPLYGKLGEGGKLSLCEIHSDDEYAKIIIHGSRSPVDVSACPFQLVLAHQSASGYWTEGKQRYEVALNETARLDDSGRDFVLTDKFEIPFWGQTAQHMFIGAYEPNDAGNRGVRVTVKVMNKSSRQLVQIIQPEDDCLFGFFTTPIYMNIESDISDGYGPHGPEKIIFNCHSPKILQFSFYRLNKSTRKFKLVPD
ncbi:MAG: hypothetical protein LBO00_01885 [Zoogloeaceae bacterium]|jgi:hypothetical protein|nr:hypothetical protein [Zoogloeaceae bacterium]